MVCTDCGIVGADVVCSGNAERASEEAPDLSGGGWVWGTYAFEFSGACNVRAAAVVEVQLVSAGTGLRHAASSDNPPDPGKFRSAASCLTPRCILPNLQFNFVELLYN
jgi:hypothetical protein